jgi:uncharacterized protein (TIGR03435 family)
MKQTMAAASWIVLSAFAAGGQTAADAPEFEVASVKPASAAEGGFGRQVLMSGPVAEMMGFSGGPGSKDPGRINYSGVSLKMLLVRAYKVRPYQVSGPGWLDTERYDIVAKLPPGTDNERLSLMLQKLLTERFRISLQRETKELPVYTLTVAKNGPKLKPAETPKEYRDDAEREAALKKSASDRLATLMRSGNFASGRSMHLASATVAKLAEMLSSHLGRPVIDMTGLEGVYSFTLSWVPDELHPMGGRGGGGAMDDAPSGPSIFAAVQEQLGLKPEAGKGPVELLVIDKADKSPVEN